MLYAVDMPCSSNDHPVLKEGAQKNSHCPFKIIAAISWILIELSVVQIVVEDNLGRLFLSLMTPCD
jgi:hypothetical protein